MNLIKRTIKSLFNTLGYEVNKIVDKEFNCPILPTPSQEIVKRATTYFSNSFSLSPHCSMTQEEIKKKIKSYFWHYPFEFDGLFVDSDMESGMGIHGRHYQRYLHIFPAVLSMTGGSLSGYTVLDIACNCGFWCIQARLAGANQVLGVEASDKNVDQANFILQLTGLEGVEYRSLNAYDVSKEVLGEFDITFFFGLLYHLDKPIVALERLYDVTKHFAVVDTSVDISSMPRLKLISDIVINQQNFSNRLALRPSECAVPLMLQHVGFREVFRVQNLTNNLPRSYLSGARRTFIAVK